MLKTKRDIEYRAAPYPGVIATIPKGTWVYLASNLPHPPWAYWAQEWDDMSEQAQSWMETYGFLIEEEDIEVEFSEITEYGKHMSIADFRDCVHVGLFVDSDGFGNLATKDKESDYEIKPSHITGKRPLPSWGKYVVWYNR